VIWIPYKVSARHHRGWGFVFIYPIIHGKGHKDAEPEALLLQVYHLANSLIDIWVVKIFHVFYVVIAINRLSLDGNEENEDDDVVGFGLRQRNTPGTGAYDSPSDLCQFG
jgi:hypothetical protein